MKFTESSDNIHNVGFTTLRTAPIACCLLILEKGWWLQPTFHNRKVDKIIKTVPELVRYCIKRDLIAPDRVRSIAAKLVEQYLGRGKDFFLVRGKSK